MGANAVLTLVIIVIVCIAVISVVAPAMLASAYNQALAAYQLFIQGQITSQLSSHPTKGQVWCNLRVDVFGQIDNPNPFNLGVYFGRASYHPEVIKSTWFNCQTLNSLVGQTSQIPLDSVAVGDGGSFSLQLVLQGQDGSKIDASVQPAMRQFIQTPSGVFPTPLSFQKTFVIDNILKEHYTVEIFSGRIINDQDAGKPYITSVGP